ncbi:MAG: hypothetical protein Q4C42_08100 [Clostridia bacterium]|nr:hypothetical protein [Clostridia bacterium]
MKVFKTLLSLLMAICLVFSMTVIPASAEGFVYDFDAHCKSIYMFSLDNNECVYALNPDEQRAIASLTKIMTYIVAYENIPDIENTKITVSSKVEEELEGTGSSLAGIYVGEEFTGLQLLNLMMIPSGNDAALTLAIYVDEHKEEISARRQAQAKVDAAQSSADAENSGDEEYIETEAKDIPNPVAVNDYDDEFEFDKEYEENETEGSRAVSAYSTYFVSLMNAKARELGCMDTHFTNPHGLYDPNHYSTARDVAKIVKYATTLPYFTEITGSTEYFIPETNICDEERYVSSTNKMMSKLDDDYEYYYSYCNGIKTGSLNESGYCIAASATYEGYSYVAICLGSPMVDSTGEEIDYHGEMIDAAELFRWAFVNLSLKNVAEAGDLLGEVSLEYAWNADKLQVVAGDNVSALLPDDVEASSILTEVELPEKVQAPVKKGDRIGSATFTYAGDRIATVDLVAGESIERSEVIQTIETGKKVVSSPLFILVGAALLIVVILYIVIVVAYNRRKKRMRQIKRYRNL